MDTAPPRSRSPTRNDDGTITTRAIVSLFHAPLGWTPPPPRRMRRVLFEINIEPLRRLCTFQEDFDIFSSATTTHLISTRYNALYTVFKVIYYDYVPRFKIWDLYDLVTSTLKGRWNLTLTHEWFYFLVPAQRGTPAHCPVTDENQSVLAFLNYHFPRWQTHQYRGNDTIRHSDDEMTAFHVELQCTLRSPGYGRR